MGIFNTSSSLYQMEEELEKHMKKQNRSIRILGDMELSREDYQYLLLKIRGLGVYKGTPEYFRKFRLSILTLFVFRIRMEKNGVDYCKKFKQDLLGLRQHQIRCYVELMLQAFDEYELNVFGADKKATVDDLLELLVIHAGIPEELQDDFCHLLDDSLIYQGDFSVVANRFVYRLPQYLKELFGFMKPDMVVQSLNYIRNMFRDYRMQGITRREAYAKYPLMSSDFMQACFRWCELQEIYARSFG